MPKRKKKRRERKRQTSTLEDHRKIGKVLQPPFMQIPLTPFNWIAEVLPEMLWIDAVLSRTSLGEAVSILYGALDILDSHVPADSHEVLTGMISSFAIVPEDRRPDASKTLRRDMLFDVAFPQDFCNALALYSQCPAYWLLEDWRNANRIDWEAGVRYLKGAVSRLWDSKSVHSTHCRMVPLARLMKHEKILFSPKVESVKLFPKYPDGLSEDEQLQVETVSRAMFGGAIIGPRTEIPQWIPYFWRHNFEISGCELFEEPPDEVAPRFEVIEQLVGDVRKIALRAQSLIEEAAQRAKLDIYDLNRDEVLFGLLSRQYRLFNALASDPSLWIPDLGGMLHRAMADTVITLKWLVKKNDSALFAKFKEFSLGRQKLLKLHVEELSDQMSGGLHDWEADLADSINEEIWEELLPIDLGATFASVNMREMAHEVGLHDLYNLVFAPASGQLHGDWVSLKSFHLQHCRNPLHRFHRLPRLSGPQMLVPGVILQAGIMFIEALEVWLDHYGLQEFKQTTQGIIPSLQEALGTAMRTEEKETEAGGS